MILLLFIFCALFTSCENLERASTYQEIAGRDHRPLYRIKAPADWERKKIEGPLDDTMKPIAEFSIEEVIRITIHNFPDTGISPQAQLARWCRQFPLEPIATPQAFSGFVGLKLESKDEKQSVIAWSLKVQGGDDVTIKVVGPHSQMEHYREAIERFARSFEFIEDL